MRALLLLPALLLAACRSGTAPPDDEAQPGEAVSLRGAGATFPALLYTRWIAEYVRAHPREEIVYESIGSSAGVRALAEGRVDFAASEAPPEEEPTAAVPGTVQIPVTLGAVVVAYNVPGLPTGLRLGNDELAAIFLGEIGRWDDPRLRRLNPDLPLPALPIAVVYRQDGSGTTAVFTRYLATVSPRFRQLVGRGSLVAFPVGSSAPGNEGVAGRVKATHGAVGYVQLAHARRLGLAMADLRNREGRFVRPSLDAVAHAARQAASETDPTLLLDPRGPASYPIAAYSFVILPATGSDATRTRALARFLWWCLHEGQALAWTLDHAPLPDAIVRLAEDRVRRLRIDGRPALDDE